MAPAWTRTMRDRLRARDRGPDSLVWYAAYGSNLQRERFELYLTGGRLESSGSPHRGARDGSPPREDRSLELQFQLYFAQSSPRWGGGGVAFLDHRPRRDVRTLARGYLVTLSQFEDVLAQENEAPTRAVKLGSLGRAGRVRLYDGWYGLVLACGTLEGRPVLTFTAPWTMHDADLNSPGPEYLRTMALGLIESHSLSIEQAVDYLLTVPGIGAQYSHGSLREAVVSPL